MTRAAAGSEAPGAAASRRRSSSRRLRDLRNLGEVTERWLGEVDIPTPAALEIAGPLEAYRRLKASRPREVTLVALWALWGALLDLDWRELPDDLKAQSREKLKRAVRPKQRVGE